MSHTINTFYFKFETDIKNAQREEIDYNSFNRSLVAFRQKLRTTYQRGRITNGEIDPVAFQINEIWSCIIFVI